MVDLGCHASHGRRQNLSDALLWLDHFGTHGSTVLSVDAVEDFAIDLQHRFDEVEPYASLTSVRKLAVAALIDSRDRTIDSADAPDIFFAIARPMMRTCVSHHWARLEEMPSPVDHYCRIVRQRLGLSRNPLRTPPSSYPARLFASVMNNSFAVFNSPERPVYKARSVRTDSLWRGPFLQGRTIDVLKIDIDMSWRGMGLEGLFANRAFVVMIIEVDHTWGVSGSPPPRYSWGVTAADQLAWVARAHGYDTFVKVPCPANRRKLGRPGLEPASAAWYYPLASPRQPFTPTALSVTSFPRTGPAQCQDLLVVDIEKHRELAALPALAASECIRSDISISSHRP